MIGGLLSKTATNCAKWRFLKGFNILRRSITSTSTCGKKDSRLGVSKLRFLHTGEQLAEEKITINFINRNGEYATVKAAPGDTLLDVVIDNDLDIPSYGVCEGTLGCSTCHVILEEKIFEVLEKDCPITSEEMDMLDLACGLTETSRLGCQVEITKKLEGCTVRVPEEAVDAREM